MCLAITSSTTVAGSPLSRATRSRKRRREGDLAAHRPLGDGGDMRLEADEIGQFVDALLLDHGRIHVGQEQPLAAMDAGVARRRRLLRRQLQRGSCRPSAGGRVASRRAEGCPPQSLRRARLAAGLRAGSSGRGATSASPRAGAPGALIRVATKDMMVVRSNFRYCRRMKLRQANDEPVRDVARRRLGVA